MVSAGLGGDRAALREGREQQADRDHRGEDRCTPTMPIGRSRSVSGEAVLPAGAARAAGGERRGDALDDRADDLEQGPDRGDADRAGADEPHLLAEGASPTNASRSAAEPSPARPVSHGTSTNQLMIRPTSIAMPTAMPTRWPTPISAIDRLAETVVAPAPNAEGCARPRRRRAWSGRGSHKRPRRASSSTIISQPAPILLGAADAGADLEHFGGGDAFGIGQVASRSPARGAAAPNTSRRGCRRWRSPRPTARRGSRSTSRP